MREGLSLKQATGIFILFGVAFAGLTISGVNYLVKADKKDFDSIRGQDRTIIQKYDLNRNFSLEPVELSKLFRDYKLEERK